MFPRAEAGEIPSWFPLDVTWGTLTSACLCVSLFLWPSSPLCSLLLPFHTLTTSQHYLCLILLHISESPAWWAVSFAGIFLHMQHFPLGSNRKPLSDAFTVCVSPSLSFNMAILEKIYLLMFTLWIIELTTRPHYHSSPIINQPWRGSFYSFTRPIDVKNTMLWGKKKLSFYIFQSWFQSYQLFGNWLWLSYLMASCPTSKVQLNPLAYSSSAVPIPLPHMVCHRHKGCTSISDSRNESSLLKNMALWWVLIALAEPRASAR